MAVTYTNAASVIDIQGAAYTTLKARFAELAAVVDAVGAERKALNNEIRRREKAAAATVRLGALKEDDKAVYREVLGIQSGTMAKLVR